MVFENVSTLLAKGSFENGGFHIVTLPFEVPRRSLVVLSCISCQPFSLGTTSRSAPKRKRTLCRRVLLDHGPYFGPSSKRTSAPTQCTRWWERKVPSQGSQLKLYLHSWSLLLGSVETQHNLLDWRLQNLLKVQLSNRKDGYRPVGKVMRDAKYQLFTRLTRTTTTSKTTPENSDLIGKWEKGIVLHVRHALW